MEPSSAPQRNPRLPWYREPWPWILMAGPLLVVVASLTTAWIAIKSSDGLVSDDYYKEGLNAAQLLASSEQARALGIAARLTLGSERAAVQLSAQAGSFQPPPALHLTLSHPTRAGLDQAQRLTLGADGQYSGSLRLPKSGHWLVLIEDEARRWRLLGNVVLPAATAVLIDATAPAAAPVQAP